MVSKKIVSLYGDKVPEDDRQRKIKGGPFYDRSHVLRLAEDANVLAWTRKCGRDIRYFGFDLEDVSELVREGLNNGRFLGSEWCEQKKDGPWAACDAYAVFRLEWSDVAYKKISVITSSLPLTRRASCF